MRVHGNYLKAPMQSTTHMFGGGNAKKPPSVTQAPRVLLLAALLMTQPVGACGQRTLPTDDFSQYATIFEGEVTGIHLTEYEQFKLREKSAVARDLSDDEELSKPMLVTSSTGEYAVFVAVERVISGSPAQVMRLQISGCMVGVPSLKDKGLFFVLPNERVAVAIYDDGRQDVMGDVFSQWKSKAESAINETRTN